MVPFRMTLMIAGAASLALAACSAKTKSNEPAGGQAAAASITPTDPINSAMAAAPEAVGRNATIAQPMPDGGMRVLRQGSNGFTCMPDNPETPGRDPMCMDANAMEWVAAWMGHSTPPSEKPGVMYMLKGGTDASNTDPYATRPTAGGDWIATGPHMMVVGSASLLRGYPSGPRPDTRSPYVMWASTPYAHLMIPVK